MKNNELVSIIIPTYNAEKWITQSIQSCLCQSYENTEIVILNDGSTDNTAAIVKKMNSTFKKIRFIELERNGGIVNALNTLIQESKGKYIARMDADDIAHPDRIKQQVTWINNRSLDLCGTWFKEFGQGFSRVSRWPTSHQALEASLLFQNTICHPTILGKREVFEKFPYREEFNMAEDYDFFCRAIHHYKIENIPNALLHYRRHPQQATQAKKDAMESITKQIRLLALNRSGIFPNDYEFSIHNMIRGSISIMDMNNLDSIEKWISHLINKNKSKAYNEAIATQWIRACVRAAPLGLKMYKKFRSSSLLNEFNATFMTNVDLAIIALLNLDYNSKTFHYLRRMGLSS